MLSQKNVWTMALEKRTLFSYDWALKRMFSNETICTVFFASHFYESEKIHEEDLVHGK